MPASEPNALTHCTSLMLPTDSPSRGSRVSVWYVLFVYEGSVGPQSGTPKGCPWSSHTLSIWPFSLPHTGREKEANFLSGKGVLFSSPLRSHRIFPLVQVLLEVIPTQLSIVTVIENKVPHGMSWVIKAHFIFIASNIFLS